MAFSSIEERLAGKFERANARATRHTDALYWILAVLEAPEKAILCGDEPVEGEGYIDAGFRRLEMVGQILRRRGISIRGLLNQT